MSISSFLYKINNFWKTGKVAKEFIKPIVRTEFHMILDSLKRERILAIIGSRRVGKSTLLFQTIDYLLTKGVNPKNILFFSGDEPMIFGIAGVNIGTVIDSYEMDILKCPLENVCETVYVFIDEIHVIPDWQLWLKSYFDRKYKIKFIISGSSGTHLFRGSKESLMGRIENVYVMPLGFREFTRFYSEYKDRNLHLDLFEMLPECSVFAKPAEYAAHLQVHIAGLENEKIIVNRLLNEYLLVGGYPEYFTAESLLYWQRQLMEDIITRGLFRDVVSIYKIKNPEILEKLLYFIAGNNGQPHSYSTLADTLGVDFTTVSNYMSYLSNAFMITILDNYSLNAGKIIRKNKKIYVSDNGISNALLRIDELNDDYMGHLVEQNCVGMAREYSEKNLFNLRYYRDKNQEIDIVLDKKTDTLPIEVKYRNQTGIKDAKAVKYFADTFGSSYSMVITKNHLEINGNIVFVPFWLIG